MSTIKTGKYLRYLAISNVFGAQRTKEILSVNPTILPIREEAREVSVCVYDYNAELLDERNFDSVQQVLDYKRSHHITWINIDGLRKNDIETIATHFGIHALLVEDILSMNQRPKMDEVEGILFCLLNMLYYNGDSQTVEQEQISIALGKDFVISFQEDATRDVFDQLRHRLQLPTSKVRQSGADYLCYSMLDQIVDNYFLVMEKLGERVETLEEEVIRKSDAKTLTKIAQLRKEMIVLKRNIVPVRDILSSIQRSESDLLDDRTTKYFKDVSDHIAQAYDLSENYRDIMVSMQDLYINNVNLRMNEVMKVMAIVTCLLAPATVIGGIFGMNFDKNVNFFHQPWGFFTAVALMLIIPLFMLRGFRRRGWF
jgi:magnesium transporter